MSWRHYNTHDANNEFSVSKYEKKKQKKIRTKQRDEIVKSCMAVTEQIQRKNQRQQNPVYITVERKKVSEIKSITRKQNDPVTVDSSNDINITPLQDDTTEHEEVHIPDYSQGFFDFFESKSRPVSSNSFGRPGDQMPARIGAKCKLGKRVAGGANGIFTRRLDFSSFNSLPKLKLNSYQIKTEDEGNHGNDDTRCFILSTLASHNRSKVQCVLCEEYLLVFDRYPLVDGTFFLSPRQHAKFCIEVKVEGRTQFLTCVCMGCLEGVSGRQVFCRFCNTKWDGSSLVLGTMYSYDIFAAMPCCTERIKCNSCFKPVLHPAQRLNYFSDYSHMVPCPHCRTLDTHFVKSLPYCFVQRPQRTFSQWP